MDDHKFSVSWEIDGCIVYEKCGWTITKYNAICPFLAVKLVEERKAYWENLVENLRKELEYMALNRA